eukprot:XP_001699598.1 predicted protein [Chlamydomonas reinhardtii]
MYDKKTDPTDYVKATALPKAWVKAKQASDFSIFAPFLKEWVEVNKEKARCGQGAEAQAALCKKVWAGGEAQAALCKKIALDLGFDTEHGRLDVSVHPFTGGAHPTDVRMTTRFKKEDVMEGITGEGRYDGLPVNSALSMGVHESQSLLWERMVGLSKPFAAYLLPLLKERFPATFGSATPQQLYEAENTIREPSLIRVTYPLHIILRYELERGLMDGSVQSYLGATPPSDAKGCLQDVHWSAGLFGYDKIKAGDFAPLKSWLNVKIHKLGSLHASGDELMTAVTGGPLDPSVFLTYLKNKYTELYKL